MKIPSEFFGTPKEVKSNCKKIITKLKKGSSLEEIVECSDYIDINDTPESLIWVDRGARMSLINTPHFFIEEFGYEIMGNKQLTYDQKAKIKDDNIEFLSSTAWGTIILNLTQIYFWDYKLGDTKISRKGFIAVIEGTIKYWDLYIAIGKRFSTGGHSSKYFNQTLPSCAHAVAMCGIDPCRGKNEDVPNTPLVPTCGNLKKICLEAGILEKVKYDDNYWNDILKGNLLEKKNF